MADKKSFILYLDHQELFNKLPDEVAGKLIKHIFAYVNNENPETSDLLLDIAFSSIKQALKRDLGKWEDKIEQKRAAGRASAEKRAQNRLKTAESVENNPTNPTPVEFVKDILTNPTVNVNESVSESVNESVNDIKTPTKPSNKFEDADLKFAEWMLDTILFQLPNFKKPNIEKWAETIRKMRTIDKRDEKEMVLVWNWARASDFWQANIQGADSFRKQYDKLMAQTMAEDNRNKPRVVSELTERNIQVGQEWLNEQ